MARRRFAATVVLQRHWDAAWWEALAALIYGSHFVVTPLVLGVLWLRNRRRWGRYVRMVLALSAAGLATYVLYPAAPPWLAAKDGVIEPVRRLSATGWEVLGLPHAGALLADSQGQVNQVAAVPSLHTAFAVLTAWSSSGRPPDVAAGRAGRLRRADAARPRLGGGALRVDTVLGAAYAARGRPRRRRRAFAARLASTVNRAAPTG